MAALVAEEIRRERRRSHVRRARSGGGLGHHDSSTFSHVHAALRSLPPARRPGAVTAVRGGTA
jgi:hypothetical protein